MGKLKIFIDAGHGGADPGAVGNGMRESDINLETATHYNNILRAAGVETLMSRIDDTQPNLRPQTANSWGADLLVSFHANAGGGTGVEVVIPTASPRNPNRNLSENRELASLFANAIGKHFGMRVRRANGVMLETETPRGSIGILRESAMPAVLPEIAFIDSPLHNPDINVLRNRRREVAEVLARVTFDYYGITSPNQTPPVKKFPIDEVNIQRMVDLGVINTPSFWKEVDCIQWLNGLLRNAGRENVLHKDIRNGITDLNTALKVLEMAGVMNSPEYWHSQVQNSSVRHLERLILSMANRCLDPLHRIVWAEARGESLKGQIAVVNVIINRHNSSQFPNGIYNVIHQPRQFSPVTNGRYAEATPLPINIRAVAEALSGVDHSRGALFFDSSPNSWARQNRTFSHTISNHSFFL